MQLKSIHQIILLLGGIFFCQLSQATPASQASIDQLFKVLQIKENTQAMIKPQELKLLGLDKKSYWNNIEPQLKELYKNNLSEEELQALNRFYQTPEGRSLSEKMPQLSQQTYKIVIKNMMSNSNISKGLFNMLGIQP